MIKNYTETTHQNRGILYIVATPIGNLGDITQRALQILQQVDRICAEDTRNTRKLLAHFGIQGELQALHEHNEQQKIKTVRHWLDVGENIALVSDAGTPLISDPGYHLVHALSDDDYPIVPIPGVSAIIAALSIAGLPTNRFTFEGFLSAKAGARLKALQENKKEPRTQIYYESSHRIAITINAMREVFGERRRVVLVREMTKMYEQVYRGDFAGLQDWITKDTLHQKGEFVLMVGGYETQHIANDNNVIPTSCDELLNILVQELPLKQAASIAAQLTGGKKNDLYRQAMALKNSQNPSPLI